MPGGFPWKGNWRPGRAHEVGDGGLWGTAEDSWRGLGRRVCLADGLKLDGQAGQATQDPLL